MSDPRHKLMSAALVTWGKYESCVRMGGTPQERGFAFAQWSKADDKLAVHDQAGAKKREREKAARSGSGK